MIGILAGLVYANAMEWLGHKYLLHGLGKRKGSFWSFHWHDHHQQARRNEMYDPGYLEPPLGWNPHAREVLGLLMGSAALLPLLPVAPLFTTTVWACTANYYLVHRRSHLDPAWGFENVPWHVDHHLGRNQDANWCVTHPFFDHVMGTRLAPLSVVSAKGRLPP